MVRLARVEAGDVVLDPMCGGGSIPLEGCQIHSNAFFLGTIITFFYL
jgi:tRNA G10  N-methylase Trm11